MVGKTISHYRIIEKLGQGGMGEVFLADDTSLRRKVALKFLPADLQQDAAAHRRFILEAHSAAALNHPYICSIYEVGDFEGKDFIVMEYVDGQTLRDKLAKGPLPLEEAIRIVGEVGEALEEAHEKRIIHRDLKPENIMLTCKGHAKVMDFGLAKQLIPPGGIESQEQTVTALTRSGMILGTLAYMSPEQAVGEEVDARSDIFSLGVVLYEMATGRPPFSGKTAAGILGSILTETPAKPSAVNAAIPAGLDRVILKALEKDREARYQSVALLAADLADWERSGAAASYRRTRRWMLTAAGAAVASVAGGVYLARRSLFPPQGRIMVAVLPFENIGANPQEEFFASGLHQDMISVLNRLYPDRLGVIARTSVRRFQASGAGIDQIGRELRVDYVVEGGVQRVGSQAHITAGLIRVRDQTSVWSATYDRDTSQILAAQAEIARSIAQGIESGLRPDARVSAALERPLNAAAHEAYLRGDYNKAVEIDPGYAAAWAGLANDLYYPGLFGFQPPREAFTGMMNAASKALSLDATQASAHACLALGKLHLEWRWSEAEEGFRRALRLNPSDPDTRHFYAHFLLWSGRRTESFEESDYALNVDPLDAGLIACLGFHNLQVGDENKALDETLRSLAIEPDNFWGLLTIGWIYEQKGRYSEALGAFRKVGFECGLKKSSIGHAFARSGDRRMAEKMLGELLAESKNKYVSPCDIAIVYTGLGDSDRAFEQLNMAYEEHSGWLIFLNSDPRFKPLRDDPRFQDLLRRMRIPALRA